MSEILDTAAEIWECTSEEYHRDTSISQSKIKHFLRDSEDFFEKDIAHSVDRSEATKSQQFGLDAERLMFFGETPGELIPLEVLQRVEANDKISHRKVGAPWREFKSRMEAEHGSDVVLMKPDEWEKRVPPILIARDKVRDHDRANKLLFGEVQHHVAIRWTDPVLSMRCKCQIDILYGQPWSILVDYKTAADVTHDGFHRAIGNYGYHIQAWWYRRAVQFLTGQLLPVVFVVSKNTPSYHCETYSLPSKWYQAAERKMTGALHQIREAFDSDTWTSDTHGRVIELEDPKPWQI